MRRIIAIAVLFSIAISILACQQQEKQPLQYPAIDTTSIKASIDSLGRVVQKAHDTKDSELLASTWAKDGILIIAGSPPVVGRRAIVSALSNMPPLPPGGKMEIHPLDIQVMSPEWAYVLGVDSLKYTTPGATKQTIETSTFFVLVRKTSEGWQTYRETLTPNQMFGKQQ
jgi:uncharacterized protein (TIGR02246 family)